MKKLEIIKPQNYFLECLREAGRDQNQPLNPIVENYLVKLLCDFVSMENFKPKPLAFILKDALEGENPHQEFKYLGDFSLYTAGFFPHSLKRKLVDVDYYIDMGRNAYESISHQNAIFNKLSINFIKIVSLLNQVSEESFTQNDDILGMYDLWKATDSPRLQKKIAKLGLIPIK